MGKQIFDTLVSYFERDTLFSSGHEGKHPYYKTIVAWGKNRPDIVIPWLMEIVHENWHWQNALWEIVGEEKAPRIPVEFSGQIQYIAEAWITWGRDNGYVL